MRVCVVTTVHRPWDGRVFQRQARTLARAGYEVFLLHQTGEPDETREGVTAIGYPRPQNRFKRALRGWTMVRRAIEMGADVVHAHDPEVLIPGVVLCRLSRRAFIYDIHEDYVGMISHKEWIPVPLRFLAKILMGAMERLFVPLCTAVVVADAQLGERFGRLNSRCAVAHNFPPSDAFPPIDAIERNEIIYEGSISPTRGAYLMCDVIERVRRRFPNVRLTMIGTIHAEEDGIRRRAAELGEAVVIEDPVPYRELPARIAGAKVGLSLWLRTRKNLINVPTKLFDYMATAVPYVASDFPHLRKLVDEAGGRLVDPDDVDSCVQAVVAFLEDDELRGEAGRRGRHAYEQKYCWERESEELLALYREIARLRPARQEAARGAR